MKTYLNVIAKRTCGVMFLVLSCWLPTTRPAHALTAARTEITSQGSIVYTDEHSNSYTGLSNDVIVKVSTVTGVSVNCESNQSTPTNVEVNYACTLTNTGNDDNTFALSASSTLAWSTALYVDSEGTRGGTTTSSGVKAASTEYKFFVTVKPPQHSGDGTINGAGTTSVFTLYITDNGTPIAATATASRTTTAQAPKLTVIKSVRNFPSGVFTSSEGTFAKPGDTLEYRLEIKTKALLRQPAWS